MPTPGATTNEIGAPTQAILPDIAQKEKESGRERARICGSAAAWREYSLQ
jgi:hypothetical protein